MKSTSTKSRILCNMFLKGKQVLFRRVIQFSTEPLPGRSNGVRKHFDPRGGFPGQEALPRANTPGGSGGAGPPVPAVARGLSRATGLPASARSAPPVRGAPRPWPVVPCGVASGGRPQAPHGGAPTPPTKWQTFFGGPRPQRTDRSAPRHCRHPGPLPRA